MYFGKQASCEYCPTFPYQCVIWICWWVTFCFDFFDFFCIPIFFPFLFLLTVFTLIDGIMLVLSLNNIVCYFAIKLPSCADMLSLCFLSLQCKQDPHYIYSVTRITHTRMQSPLRHDFDILSGRKSTAFSYLCTKDKDQLWTHKV